MIILVAAAALVARAVIKKNDSTTGTKPSGFAAMVSSNASPAHAGPTDPSGPDAIAAIGGLVELDTIATNMAGVFVFLPGTNGTTADAPTAKMLGAARTIEANMGCRIGIFTLKTGSPDHEQLASQMAVPGVIALTKAGGIGQATGEITEAKLIQAFVAASSVSACGPAGCGPAGCN